MNFRLPKSHRLHSRTAIERLFDRSLSQHHSVAYPLRAVWAPQQPTAQPAAEKETGNNAAGAAPDRILIIVPKKQLRHAVDRVTMRRRIREAYRLCRHDFPPTCPTDIAFIYLSRHLRPWADIDAAVRSILQRIHP